tara:strand:+ start:78 stop:437 length:360 start_codon:yes stop_codon:yes gene_type:complete
MELAKLLVKIIYLVLIYGIVFNVLKMQTSLLSYKLMFTSLFVSVIFMYFTFNYVYSFLVNSEIIFKNVNKTENQEPTKQQSKNRTEINNKTFVDKENTSKNKFVMDHSHKFVEDNIFGN